MAAQAKKTTTGAAKTATNAANRAAQVTLTAVETTRNSAENVVKIGTEAVKEFMSSGADEAQRIQEKAFAMGREGVENITKSANAATKTINEMLEIGRDNAEACIECGNVASTLAQNLSAEIFAYANNTFSENVEISKQIFSCRTVNDLFDLQGKLFKNNIDALFNQSVKMTELAFQYASEAVEPINERVAETSERFSKSLAAA